MGHQQGIKLLQRIGLFKILSPKVTWPGLAIYRYASTHGFSLNQCPGGYNTDSIEDLHENVWEKMLFFGLLHVKFHIHKYRGYKASLSCVDSSWIMLHVWFQLGLVGS